MNKKEYKRREFNHINTNPKKKKKKPTRNFSRIFLHLEPNTNYQQKHSTKHHQNQQKPPQ